MRGLIHKRINKVITRLAEIQRMRHGAQRWRTASKRQICNSALGLHLSVGLRGARAGLAHIMNSACFQWRVQSGRHTALWLALLLMEPLNPAAAATQSTSATDGGWRPEQVQLCADLQIPPDKIEELAADSKPNKLELPKTSWRTFVFPRRNFLMCIAESSHIADQDKVRAAKVLVRKKVKINLTDAMRYTALHLAALGNAPLLARYLLDEGAIADVANSGGETPFLLAVKAGHRPLINLLVEHGPVDRPDLNGRTPLLYAAGNGDVETIRLLIDRGANTNGLSADLLVAAASSGSVDLFRYLVDERKMSHEVRGKDGRSLLMIAAAQNRLPLVRHLVEERAANVSTASAADEMALNFSAMTKSSDAKDVAVAPLAFLLRVGSGDYDSVLRPIELVPGARDSALSLAAAAGHVEVMRYLMAHGATNDDSVPSALAAAAREARLDAVQLLIEAGADIGPGTEESPGVMYWGAIGRDPRVLDTLIARGVAMSPILKSAALLVRARASRSYGLTLLAHQKPAEALPHLRDALAIYSRAVDDLTVRNEAVMTGVGWGFSAQPAISDKVVVLKDGTLSSGSFTIRYRNNMWHAVVVRDERVYAFGPVFAINALGEPDRGSALEKLNSEAQNARDNFRKFVTELTEKLECARTAAAASASSVGAPCVEPSR
jgi:ankyrin repeat protein